MIMKHIFLLAILLFAAAIVNAQTIEGNWSATIRGPIATIEFRSPAFDHNSWTDITDFRLSEFGNSVNDHFSFTREAGTLSFQGKLDNGKGSGNYIFMLSKPFTDAVAASGVTTVNALEGFAFFRSGFKLTYINMLRHAGFKGIAAHEVISMYALKIDEPFINQFKAVGYSDIPPHNLITFKATHIDAAFISGFRKLGYSNIPLNDLPALKANHITPEYVAEMQQKGIRETSLRKYIQLKRGHTAQ
jgi:hypothetical protein